MKLIPHLSALFLGVAPTTLSAAPAGNSCASAEQIFALRDVPGAAFTECLRAAARQDPVRAYRIATVTDFENPIRFSEPNRAMVIDTAINSLQPHLDRNLNNTEDRIEIRHVDTLNTLHDFPGKWRFETLGRLNANGLYQLMTKGRSEMFTSTFNALYDGFMNRMGREGATFTAFLGRRTENVRYLPEFIDAVSVFGKFAHFNQNTTTAEKNTILMTIMDGIKAAPTNAAIASIFLKHLGDNDAVRGAFETRLIQDYQGARDAGTKDMLGILGAWYAREQGVRTPGLAQPFAALAANMRYALPVHDEARAEKFFDAGQRNFQLHLFYNDKDGIENYASYAAQLRGDGWSARSIGQGRFTHFQKTENGRAVHIYATVPTLSHKDDDDYTVQSAGMAKRDIAGQGGNVSVLVHRGHTYTVGSTIGLVDRNVALVVLGACGGTQFIEATLKRNQAVQIVASASIGYREINNGFLRLMNRGVLSGTDFAWQPVADQLVAAHGENARYYVMPNQNMMARFVAKHLDLQSSQPSPAIAVPPPSP